MNLISRNEELAEACARLGSAPFVAVDTEFMREQTFWPKLCLVQLASDGTEVLVDSLAPGLDLTPLFELMVNERVLKVFHSARQDVEIVHHLARVIPYPIFDTQVAAMVCGSTATSTRPRASPTGAGAPSRSASSFMRWAMCSICATSSRS
jgi:ribonuclease D